MTLLELDRIFRQWLPIDALVRLDNSLNGIQIGRDEQEIRKIAFAVDASMETFQQAKAQGADLLFVHHGLFWGVPVAIRGVHYRRLRFALENDLSLYAVHLPLDQDETLGNNAVMAEILGLTEKEPFAEIKGEYIGWKGRLSEPMSCDDIVQRLFGGYQGVHLLRYGKEPVETVGIVSGGAPNYVYQAAEQGLDLFITGEPSHNTHNFCLEQGISVLAGGHYQTETFGVEWVRKKVESELKLETTSIDIPTGL